MIIRAKVKGQFLWENCTLVSVSKVIPAWLDLFCKLAAPQSTPLTQKASRNCSWAVILRCLLCQMLALLLQAGLNMGQEPGARPSPSQLAQALPPTSSRRRLKRSEGSHKPGATAGGRKKAQPVLFGAAK